MTQEGPLGQKQQSSACSEPDAVTINGRPSIARSPDIRTTYQAPAGGVDRLNIGLARGSGSHLLEIQALLRQRLRILAIILLSGVGFFNASRFLRLDFTADVIWRFMVPGAAYLILTAVLAGILWRARIYTLTQLRRFEGVLFGLTVALFLSDTYNSLFANPAWLIVYAQRHASEMSILARQMGINWMTLIIAYGTFIPNTGRRCAVVAILMAFSPLTLIASAALLQHTVPPLLLFVFLSEIVMWLGIAVAIAIYGSHKISVLREEALAARKLGQYQLKQRLGEGGMGEVYLAEHVLLKRSCAVKVIRPEQAGDQGTLQRFLREVRATATLTHPNTIQVFDYGQADDGTVFYAMEYLSGLSLQELVDRHGPLPSGRAILVVRQLCGALAEAHGIGLIHRDIKPSNVILCSRGGLYDVAKLLDFGLVRMQATEAVAIGLTQAGLVFGTPAYMSPEQAVGNRELDARADIYSLGALAYFLLTGSPPFVRDSIVETLAAHINTPVIPLGHRGAMVSDDLEAVVMQCLAKDPCERFADVPMLDRALSACRAADQWTQSDALAWWSALPPNATSAGSHRVAIS